MISIELAENWAWFAASIGFTVGLFIGAALAFLARWDEQFNTRPLRRASRPGQLAEASAPTVRRKAGAL